MIDIREYIFYALLNLDHFRKRGEQSNIWRCYGALECALAMADVLKAGENLVYGEKEYISWTMLVPRRRKRPERYGEMIERLAREYLAKDEVVTGGQDNAG